MILEKRRLASYSPNRMIIIIIIVKLIIAQTNLVMRQALSIKEEINCRSKTYRI